MKRKIHYVILSVISFCCLNACEKPLILLDQPNEDLRSLGGFISNNFDYTLFAAALEYTGLLDTLTNGTGPFTVLAADNEAFNALGITRVEEILAMDRDSLRYAMQYHILPIRLMETDVPSDNIDLRYMTLAGTALYASRAISSSTNASYSGRSLLYFSGADAKSKDMEYSNGIMHTLSKLMKPHPGKTVQELLAEKPQYSTFVAGLKKFGLWDELSTGGPFTIFAAQNEYLAEYGITEESIAAMDASQYIGDRLFGAYIMYNKHYFILDGCFFLWSEGQVWYVAPLRNDPEYYQIFMNADRYAHGMAINRYLNSVTGFSLGISRQTYPYGYYAANTNPGTAYQYTFNIENFLGKSGQVYGYSGTNFGLAPSWNDHLCENGLVHDLQGVLVLPDEAKVGD